MGLDNLSNETEFTPYLKYNAKAGRFYAKVEGQDREVEIEQPRLAVDFKNIKLGWFVFREGMGPEKVYDPSLKEMAPRPTDGKDFKRGFEVMVYGADPLRHYDNVTLGLREFCSTSKATITAIKAMYAEYERGAAEHQTEVPFFGLTRVVPVNSMYGTNYEPEFKLLGWVPRAKVPAFDERLTERAATPPASSNASTGGYGMQPPAGSISGFDDVPFDAAPPPAVDLDDDIPF